MAAEPAGAPRAAGAVPAVADARVGIALAVAAGAMFACLDASAKFLSDSHHVVQIVWARYVFQFLLVPVVIGRVAPRRLLHTRRPGLQIVRSLLLLAVTATFFTAISLMPLADVAATTMVAPLLVTVLAIPILGETVGARRWTAVAIGLLGALVIIRPGLGVFQWAALLPLVTALCFSLYQITTRILAPVDEPVTTYLYTGVVGLAATSAAVPFVWQAPEPGAWALMVLIGLLGGGGHYLLIQAYRRAQASVLAPLSFLSLVWVTILGYLVFGDFPDVLTIAGALTVVASGVFVFHRERVTKLEARGA